MKVVDMAATIDDAIKVVNKYEHMVNVAKDIQETQMKVLETSKDPTERAQAQGALAAILMILSAD